MFASCANVNKNGYLRKKKVVVYRNEHRNTVGRLTLVLASIDVSFCERTGASGIAESLIMPTGKYSVPLAVGPLGF